MNPKVIMQYPSYYQFSPEHGDFHQLLIAPGFTQRGYLIESHVEEILNHIRKYWSRNKYPLLGAIDIAHYDNHYYIVDGQHRHEAIRRFYLETRNAISILGIVTTITTLEELREMFILRNLGIPIPQYLKEDQMDKMPLLREIDSYLPTIQNFDRIKTNRPFMNINTFLNALKESKIFTLITSLKDFQNILIFVNNDLKQKLELPQYIKQLAVSDIMKQNCNGNYIALDKNFIWMNDPHIMEQCQRYLTAQQ